MSEEMCDFGLKLSPTDRHQLMSRWHSPNTRDLCRDRLLSRLKQCHEMRSSLVDRMRKIDFNDMEDSAADEDNDNYIDEELQHMMTNDEDMRSMFAQEAHQLAAEVRHEFLEEQNRSWEGLQTKEDQRKSQMFLSALHGQRVIPCPYCKVQAMHTTDGYLACVSCGTRFQTDLTVDQIIARMCEVLNYHSMSNCSDQFPQFNMFKSNRVIYCDTCPLNQFIL